MRKGRAAGRAILLTVVALAQAWAPALAQRVPGQHHWLVDSPGAVNATFDVGGTATPVFGSLTLTNVGSTVVRDVRASVNGKDWSSIDRILAGVLDPDMTEADKARAIFDFVRRHNYHWWPVTEWTWEPRDPVKLFNAYGYGLCGDVANALAALFMRAGFPVRLWNPGSPPAHVVTEAYYDGRWHLFDADLHGLYLLPDASTVAGVEDLIANPSLLRPAGPDHEALAQLYASTPADAFWTAEESMSSGHEVRMTLRPGESLELPATNDGLFHDDTGWEGPTPYYLVNGYLRGFVEPAAPSTWTALDGSRDLGLSEDAPPTLGPADRATPSTIDYPVSSPYPIVGARVRAAVFRQRAAQQVDVFVTRPVTALRLTGVELARGDLGAPALVDSANVGGFAADGSFPLVHPAETLEPAWLTYRVTPGDDPDRGLRVVGRFFRWADADRLVLHASRDGLTWNEVWSAEGLRTWEETIPLPDWAAPGEPMFLRLEMLAASLAGQGPDTAWTAGFSELRIEGVDFAVYERVWTSEATDLVGELTVDLDLDAVVESGRHPASYEYAVRVVFRPDGEEGTLGLRRLELTSVLQVALVSLPALRRGENTLEVASDADAPGQVKIDLQWEEEQARRDPDPPARPVCPAEGQAVTPDAGGLFRWQAAEDADGDGINQYHVQVCLRPDCAWAVAPAFDVSNMRRGPGADGQLNTADDTLEPNDEPAWQPPSTAWLAPPVTYYWRVRAQDTTGGWSGFSPVWTFTVAPPDASPTMSLVELVADRGGPYLTDQPITWRVTGCGTPGDTEYTFWLLDRGTGTWTVLRHADPGDTFVWIPTRPGRFRLQAWATRRDSPETVAAWINSADFQVLEPRPAITGLTVLPGGPLAAGDEVSIEARVEGSEHSLQFQYWLLEEATEMWTLLPSIPGSKAASWVPDRAGAYVVQVWARRAASDVEAEDWKSFPLVVREKVVTRLTLDAVSPSAPGAPVTATAAATPEDEPLEFRFWLYSAAANTWVSAGDYGPARSFTWTPAAPGSYHVQVWARRVGSAHVNDSWSNSGVLVVAAQPVSHVGVTVMPGPTAQVGATTTVSASAEPGAGAEFKFWVLDVASRTWFLLRDYSPSPEVPWIPTAPGQYVLQVWARASGSAAAWEAWAGTELSVTGVMFVGRDSSWP